MASTVLPNGIIIPEKYSRDWYADLYHNWQELDNLLGGGTPKDGTLTIQKNGTAVGTFSANQATDETLNITVPDVNDATLTIQQNGANVQTFTANASTNATANIQCVDLTNNQTVAGNKEFTGTTTAHDLVPSATDTYNFGSSTAQWNNAYIKSLTINGTAAGDILTHNANEFVGVTGNQTIGGNKTFMDNAFFNPYRVKIKHGSQEIGVVPSANQWNGINFIDKNNSSTFSIEQAFLSDGNTMLHFSMTPNIAGGSLLRIFESTYNASTAEIVTKLRTLIPDVNNSRDLGTSTNKWKSFNGINPGALSLPSGTVGMNVIGDVSVVGTEKKLSKDITITGFVYVDVSFTSSNRLNLYNDTKKYGIWLPCDSGRIRQIMPISAGDRLEFNVLDAGSTINAIQIFTCQGNV